MLHREERRDAELKNVCQFFYLRCLLKEEEQENNLTAEFIQKETEDQRKTDKKMEPNSTNCLICLLHRGDGLPISLE